jgi:hypothetical protein
MWTSPIFPPSRVRKAPYGVMRLTVPSMTAPTSRSARTPPRSELRRPPCRSTPAHRRIASLPSARLGRQRVGLKTPRGGVEGSVESGLVVPRWGGGDGVSSIPVLGLSAADVGILSAGKDASGPG